MEQKTLIITYAISGKRKYLGTEKALNDMLELVYSPRNQTFVDKAISHEFIEE